SVLSVLMGISDAGRQMPSCMATLLYCERGACGPDGACWFCCRSSDFFSESRMPPPDGGDTGVAGPAGRDCAAGLASMTEIGLRGVKLRRCYTIGPGIGTPARLAVN